MSVVVVQVPGCPNAPVALARVAAALDRLGLHDVHIESVVVSTPDEAMRLGVPGSPTVLVNGRDAFPIAGRVGSLSCRLYSTPEGAAGAPTVEQLVAAFSAVGPT